MKTSVNLSKILTPKEPRAASRPARCHFDTSQRIVSIMIAICGKMQGSSALRFGDARAQALFAVLLLLCLQLEGFIRRKRQCARPC